MATSLPKVSRQKAAKLICALDFWEWYPYWLKECRAAVTLIEEHKDHVAVIVQGQADSRIVSVANATRFRYGLDIGVSKPGWTLALAEPTRKADIVRDFSQVGLILGEPEWTTPCIVTPALYRNNSITIHEHLLESLHEQAERILCAELERRNMDSSALVISGRICRNICGAVVDRQCERGNPVWPHWPKAVRTQVEGLHSRNFKTVRGAERKLIRLRTQMASAIGPAAVECLVTLQQAAATVNRSKRTLEKHKAEMPVPRISDGGGKADEWAWSELRPWLEEYFGRTLPERFPADQFRKG